MTDKLKGLFHGCPHHGDDYEACIQHSGTAPCGVEEERDALAAHVERQDMLLKDHFEEWEADTGKWDEFEWHDQ